MKLLRIIILNLLLLVAMMLMSTVVVWLMTVVFSAEFENTVGTGLKVGIVVWLLLLLPQIFKKAKKSII